MKKSWTEALSKFLESWIDRKKVIGALVSGSRVYGTESINSDIDIHIILRKGTKWRERGNQIIEGYLIEYFANPYEQLLAYHKNDFSNYSHTDARMFAQGEVIFDKTGDVKKLVSLANKQIKKPFPKISTAELEHSKYFIWDEFDNLEDLHKTKSPNYDFLHKLLLQKILENYRRYLGVEVSASAKLYRFFSDKKFQKRYGLAEFPDKVFSKLFVECLKDANFKRVAKLVAHTLKKMGGFNIDGWKLRGKLDL